MKLLTQYLEPALTFERLAEGEEDPKLKAELEGQATTSRKLAADRRRCERTVQIYTSAAIRCHGGLEAGRAATAGGTYQQRTGRHEEDGWWPTRNAVAAPHRRPKVWTTDRRPRWQGSSREHAG
jgi:hypothetical protein